MRYFNLLAIAITSVVAIGCTDRLNRGGPSADPQRGVEGPTYLDRITERAQQLYVRNQLISNENSIKEFTFDKEAQVFGLRDNTSDALSAYKVEDAVKGKEDAILIVSAETLSSDIDPEKDYKVLWLQETIDGYEGEILIVSGAVTQQMKNTPKGHLLDYDYGNDYKVRGFVKHVARHVADETDMEQLEETEEADGVADISSVYWNAEVPDIGVRLEGRFDGIIQLTNADIELTNWSKDEDPIKLTIDNYAPYVMITKLAEQPSMEPFSFNFDINVIDVIVDDEEKTYSFYSLAITHLPVLESHPQPVSTVSMSAPKVGNNMTVEDPANSGCMRPIDATDRDRQAQWRNCVNRFLSPQVLQGQLVNSILEQQNDAEENADVTDQ